MSFGSESSDGAPRVSAEDRKSDGLHLIRATDRRREGQKQLVDVKHLPLRELKQQRGGVTPPGGSTDTLRDAHPPKLCSHSRSEEPGRRGVHLPTTRRCRNPLLLRQVRAAAPPASPRGRGPAGGLSSPPPRCPGDTSPPAPGPRRSQGGLHQARVENSGLDGREGEKRGSTEEEEAYSVELL